MSDSRSTPQSVLTYLTRLRWEGTPLEQVLVRAYFPRGLDHYSTNDRRTCAERIRSELAHGTWALVDGQLHRVSRESPEKARADLFPPDLKGPRTCLP